MTQELWNILTKTTDWVKYSDAKAVLLLTLHGVVLTIVYTNANSVYDFSSTNWFTILLTILISGTSLTSIIYSFLVVNPRLKNTNPTSLIYFGHIQEKFKNHKDYFQTAKTILKDKELLDEQLAEQIYTNSKVAWKKFSFITLSLRYFFVSILLFSITLLYYFISK
ncbi:MAG: DUF5706 domain-containing protein [Saprospiraceae bacterium]|nr:DUF5706 domain-containing protein [Saprospiraceae bacterium]